MLFSSAAPRSSSRSVTQEVRKFESYERDNSGTVSSADTAICSVSFPSAPQRISVVDFDMPFGRMVVFMIKWAFAAIPALIVILAVVFVCLLIFAAFFCGIAALSQQY
jgi:hypothetical protein